MTRPGYEKLSAELDRLKHVDRHVIIKAIAEARAHGDLSENAEYHAAREDQGILQARVNELKDRLSRALIIEKNSLPSDTVIFGSLERHVRRTWGLGTA